MNNPWELITLSDYENHMKAESVLQLQVLNQIMKEQFEDYKTKVLMILGIAGGNGLEHLRSKENITVYGIDINATYLAICKERYPDMLDRLHLLCVDVKNDPTKLPQAEMLIANLLIEYIGYASFQRIIDHVQPLIISCVIQKNIGNDFISSTPYEHAFDSLHTIHHPIEEDELHRCMQEVGYHQIKRKVYPLPNGKMLLRLDYTLSK